VATSTPQVLLCNDELAISHPQLSFDQSKYLIGPISRLIWEKITGD
jgi:hypothetical protein